VTFHTFLDFFSIKFIFLAVVVQEISGSRYRLRKCQKRNGATQHYVMILVATLCLLLLVKFQKA